MTNGQMPNGAYYFRRKDREMMKKIIGVCLVLMILASTGCKSKEEDNKDSAAGPETSVLENEAKIEQLTVQQKPEPNSISLTILCSDCGKDFKISEDKKMMVCSGCGKKIDVNTFEQMRLEKIIEAMKKMQNE
jgi:DNA-directed RNA polymerase subunit RPC12/RpoP